MIIPMKISNELIEYFKSLLLKIPEMSRWKPSSVVEDNSIPDSFSE
jgi:hypothetical protein